MVIEAVQNYVNMVGGINKATREKAVAAAKGLLAQAGLDEMAADAQERVSKLAEEIMTASQANRELLENLIKAEMDKAAAKLGFVRAEELADVRAEIAELRLELTELAAAAVAPSEPAQPAAKRAAPVKKAPAKKAAAKPPLTSRGPTKKAPAKKASASEDSN